MTITSWLDVDGDNTLALDWTLDENSHVWEIGGFEGRWAAQITEKFNCFIDIFEPQSWAVEKMRERFKDNSKITIHPYGLWIRQEWMRMGDYFTDGASILKESFGDHLVEFKGIFYEIDGFGHEIDLCLMNIEGAEFFLIPSITYSGRIARLKRFWCQFHTFADETGEKTKHIYKKMEETHRLLWDHYPTAVAWERK